MTDHFISKTALLAVTLLGATALCGAALQAAPLTKTTPMAMEVKAPAKVAAGEKKEIEGTKADMKEDKAEAAKKADAMEDKTEAKVKHRHHKMKEKI